MLDRVIDDIRQHYVETLQIAFAGPIPPNTEWVFEPAYRDSDGNLLCEGSLLLPMRADAVQIRNGSIFKSVVIDSPTILKFEPYQIRWKEILDVLIYPFGWDGCVVSMSGDHASTDFDWLRDWFMRWFDSGDTRQRDSQGLRGVLHFLSDPIFQGNRTTFQIDLGSVSTEALSELIDLISSKGVQEVSIGQGD